MLSQKIKDHMIETPQTIGEDMVLTKAMEIMRDRHIRHLPVQYGGKLVGILTDRDIKLALSVHPAAKDLKIGDIMTEEPFAVHEDAEMAEVLSSMARNKFGCAVITNSKGRAIGIFTATDALRLLSGFFMDMRGRESYCG